MKSIYNNNKKLFYVLVFFIILVAVAIGVLIGYFLFNSSDNDSENNNNNENEFNDKINNNDNSDKNENNSSNNDDEADQNYSLTEAEELMNKYLFNDRYITDLDEGSKNNLAFYNTENIDTYTCNQIYGDEAYDPAFDVFNTGDGMWDCKNGESKFFAYKDVLNAKKELFGSNSTLNTESSGRYIYNKEHDLFVYGWAVYGIVGYPSDFIHHINYARIYDEVLKIGISETVTNVVAITESGEETETTTTRREYSFKQENGKYYLFNIEEKK